MILLSRQSSLTSVVFFSCWRKSWVESAPWDVKVSRSFCRCSHPSMQLASSCPLSFGPLNDPVRPNCRNSGVECVPCETTTSLFFYRYSNPLLILSCASPLSLRCRGKSAFGHVPCGWWVRSDLPPSWACHESLKAIPLLPKLHRYVSEADSLCESPS